MVTLKWKEKVMPWLSAGVATRCQAPDLGRVSCPSFLLSPAGDPLLHFTDQQIEVLPERTQILDLPAPATASTPGEGPLHQTLTFCPMMPLGPISPRGPGSP